MAISKYSRQRELIHKAVMDNNVHPTAEFIYNYLKKDNPQLSLGTVYRNLQQLYEKGEIHRLSLPNQPDRYDGVLAKHYHAICNSCGKVIDINIDKLSDIDELVSRKTGLEIIDHNIIFNTICPMCKKN